MLAAARRGPVLEVVVDELGEEWTDEKLCRVTEDVPTKFCLKEEEWRTLWTAQGRCDLPPVSVGFLRYHLYYKAHARSRTTRKIHVGEAPPHKNTN